MLCVITYIEKQRAPPFPLYDTGHHLDLHLLTDPLVGGGDAGVLEVGNLTLYLTCFKLLHGNWKSINTGYFPDKPAFLLCTECSQTFKKPSRQNSKSKTFSAADFPRVLSKSNHFFLVPQNQHQGCQNYIPKWLMHKYLDFCSHKVYLVKTGQAMFLFCLHSAGCSGYVCC